MARSRLALPRSRPALSRSGESTPTAVKRHVAQPLSPDWVNIRSTEGPITKATFPRMEDSVTTNEQVMQLLADRVPVTLLLDLLATPDAAEVFRTEGGDADWLAGLRVAAA